MDLRKCREQEMDWAYIVGGEDCWLKASDVESWDDYVCYDCEKVMTIELCFSGSISTLNEIRMGHPIECAEMDKLRISCQGVLIDCCRILEIRIPKGLYCITIELCFSGSISTLNEIRMGHQVECAEMDNGEFVRDPFSYVNGFIFNIDDQDFYGLTYSEFVTWLQHYMHKKVKKVYYCEPGKTLVERIRPIVDDVDYAGFTTRKSLNSYGNLLRMRHP
ncbi:hypothetical protein LXL04_006915 [Taraxacum kok-saghyz]